MADAQQFVFVKFYKPHTAGKPFLLGLMLQVVDDLGSSYLGVPLR
jgi:hypothetical protein